MTALPYVALGGALGASLRYILALAFARVWPGTFPVAILSVNVIGSVVMGICMVYLAKNNLGPWAPFVLVGILGGFTTFSAFSLEAYTLLERGDIGAAGLYVVLSVGLSIAGLAIGVALARGILG
jgi:CrcB protein